MMTKTRALYIFLLMPSVIELVITSAELMIQVIKYWIKNAWLRKNSDICNCMQIVQYR